MQHRKRIIHIEDREPDRQLARLILRADDPTLQVRPIRNAEEFAHALAEQSFDLVLLANRVSWADGLMLLRLIRKNCPGTPVLFLVSPVDLKRENQLLRAGPQRLLTKSSTSLLRLPDEVRHFLQQRRRITGRRIEDRLRILLDRTGMGVFRANIYGRILEANQSMVRILGFRTNRQLLDYHPPDLFYRSRSTLELSERVRRHGPSRRRLADWPDRNGRPVPVVVMETVVKESSGEVFIYALVEKQSHIPESRTADHDPGEEFASLAAHELQEPLRMVERYTHFLYEDYNEKLDQEGVDYLRFAHQGAKRLQNMVDDLLALSRVEQGPATSRPVSPLEILEEALENLSPRIRETQTRIRWSKLPDRVLGDRGQLVRLFQNLLSNAIKFTAPGTPPRITIQSARASGRHVFSISDNGLGIPDDQLDQIFERFTRLHPDRPGTGLGLSICRRIVERHQGRIWAKSKPGQGTTFFFTLPGPSDATGTMRSGEPTGRREK